jgi:hypothetical protein
MCESCAFCVDVIQRICLFSDDFYSYRTLILAIARKYCMDIGARPHVCVVFLMSFLTHTNGLCCAGFIYPTLY